MSQIKSRNTKPELIVRRYLSRRGYRYRLNYTIHGKPDIVFVSKRIAVFVHGCFWHLHNCKNSSIPKTNTKFWEEKLYKNKDRDSLVRENLKSQGWSYMTVWECEIEKNPGIGLEELIKQL